MHRQIPHRYNTNKQIFMIISDSGKGVISASGIVSKYLDCLKNAKMF